MKFRDFLVPALISLMICASASAKDFQLVCTMNTNVLGAQGVRLESIVPAHATHVVKSDHAEIAEISMQGQAANGVSRVKLNYEGNLRYLGVIYITYTYIKSTGDMIAKTKTLRANHSSGELPPESSGEFLVNGHCVMK